LGGGGERRKEEEGEERWMVTNAASDSEKVTNIHMTSLYLEGEEIKAATITTIPYYYYYYYYYHYYYHYYSPMIAISRFNMMMAWARM